MFDMLVTTPTVEAVKELARVLQAIIVWFGLTMIALVVWLAYLQEKFGKLKKRIRQLEDWKLQVDARLSPKS